MVRQQNQSRKDDDLDEQLEEHYGDEGRIDEVMTQIRNDPEVHSSGGSRYEQVKIEDDDEIEDVTPPKKGRMGAPADGIYTQALMKDSSSNGTPEAKKHCFYKTLLVFKGHLQNRLSVFPDPSYSDKVQAWKESLDENEINPKKLLDFFQDEMKSFVDTMVKTPQRPIQARGMEFLDDVLAGKKLTPKKSASSKSEASSPKKKSTPKRIPGVSKEKQTMCRACKEYFIKTDECQNICPRDECQARKCQKCDKERVLFRKKDCCKSCSDG